MTTDLPKKPRPSGFRKKSANPDSSSVRHGYVKSFDNTKLFFSIEGKGKPIVFCYGLVCSSLHWTYQIDYFKRSHKAVWFDYRGHNNSETPVDLKSLTLENLARDLGSVLDELKIDNAVLLGHSMGVNVVLDFYKKNPKRVAGLILANGTAQRPLETILRHNALQSLFKGLRRAYETAPDLVTILWRMQRNAPFTRTLIKILGFNPHLAAPEDVNLYLKEVSEMDPAIFLNLIENYDNYDATSWLHTIKCPTLVIAGRSDKIIPLEQQELLHQLIPNSQLEVVFHGSHCPQMDLPDQVNLRIEKFLSSINYGLSANPTMETASLSTV
ncbi:MAG: alpha/beta hydrolase [Bdellovibrionota bacterium]